MQLETTSLCIWELEITPWSSSELGIIVRTSSKQKEMKVTLVDQSTFAMEQSVVFGSRLGKFSP